MRTYLDRPTFDHIYQVIDGNETYNPTAIRLGLCDNHQFLTFSNECECDSSIHGYFKYAVIGLNYGWAYANSGNYKLWNNPSSAYQYARECKGLY